MHVCHLCSSAKLQVLSFQHLLYNLECKKYIFLFQKESQEYEQNKRCNTKCAEITVQDSNNSTLAKPPPKRSKISDDIKRTGDIIYVVNKILSSTGFLFCQCTSSEIREPNLQSELSKNFLKGIYSPLPFWCGDPTSSFPRKDTVLLHLPPP